IYRVKLNKIKTKIFQIRKNSLKRNYCISIKPYLNKNFLPNLELNLVNIVKCFISKNCFKIFGEEYCFKNKINWHQDFKNKKINNKWKNSPYQKIKSDKKKDLPLNKFDADIKIPWELSRLQHIPYLAYLQKNNLFKKHINDWIDNNPFLIGVNWVCPMEIAIRAINLIYGFYYLNYKNDENFYKKLINSLYQHAIYLENNFEIFYKPNNHYIADLIGYFYLCFFFDHIKHFQKAKIKTYKKILEQFELQIQEDGSDYEGSTSYHKLVVEMFFHFYYLCKKNNLELPNNFIYKLKKANQFINDCYDNHKNFIQIGDNDSGKILDHVIYPNFNRDDKILTHYPNFGLSIIKNKDWHITYRHPTFNEKQPTGHFHQDSLSLTLSYKGIPILIDPGTYVYTANKNWRNLMRSYDSHNTFYIDTQNIDNQDLFLLNKREQEDTSKIQLNSKIIVIKNYYLQNNIKLYRKLLFDNQKIIINDWFEKNLKKTGFWNFIFHPKINIKQKNKNKFEIIYKEKKIFYLESNLNLRQKLGYYSPEYGKIEICTKLFAQTYIDYKKNKTILYPAKT
ncbi:hypothetical protein GF385_03505, partial [Candidatus Dependentiae bacterium]|nr:hypothetical protein [Candidatus Dependentiae bacterium]